MSKKNVTAFLEKLSEDKDFRREIGKAFLDIEEGDWRQVVRLAKSKGFTFTKKELLAGLPEGFFRGRGQNPEAGWDISTREGPS